MARKGNTMDTMCYKEQLEEFMLLHNKSALDANEEERRSCLCTSLYEESFCESVLELLDHDNTLTGQILNYLYSSGYNIEQVVFGGIAIGLYLLKRLLPEDGELINHFKGFWIEPCDLSEEMTSIVDAAINRALNKMIADET